MSRSSKCSKHSQSGSIRRVTLRCLVEVCETSVSSEGPKPLSLPRNPLQVQMPPSKCRRDSWAKAPGPASMPGTLGTAGRRPRPPTRLSPANEARQSRMAPLSFPLVSRRVQSKCRCPPGGDLPAPEVGARRHLRKGILGVGEWDCEHWLGRRDILRAIFDDIVARELSLHFPQAS